MTRNDEVRYFGVGEKEEKKEREREGVLGGETKEGYVEENYINQDKERATTLTD